MPAWCSSEFAEGVLGLLVPAVLAVPAAAVHRVLQAARLLRPVHSLGGVFEEGGAVLVRAVLRL
eukprot:2197026-Pyramimonas_sp.AAC.1